MREVLEFFAFIAKFFAMWSVVMLAFWLILLAFTWTIKWVCI